MSRTVGVGTLMAAIVAFVVVVAGSAYLSAPRVAPGELVQFRSYQEYEAFLNRTGYFPGGGGAEMLRDGRLAGLATTEGDASGTNVQVAGVDELDIVKTDGTHVFIASGDKVLIIRATPTSMEVVGTIDARSAAGGDVESAWVAGLFLAGDEVIVVISGWRSIGGPLSRPSWDIGIWYPGVGVTYVASFDVSIPAAPTRLWTHGVSGTPNTARLSEGHAYVVVTDWIPRSNETYLTPTRCARGTCAPMALTSIWYDPSATEAGAVTHVLAVRLADGEGHVLSVMGGATSTVYMSRTSLYLSATKWDGSLDRDARIRTTIHRVSVDGLQLVPVAAGDVPGTPLNQWAMDESAGRLRIATTSGDWQEPTNGVYVLDGSLSVLSSLEGLAPSERIFASRYVGDTLYLVTFRQVDPLFVIDLSSTSGPRVVGELEIPGFSAYLHPYSDGRLVGVGQEAGAVKVSMFDVRDPARPTEIDTYLTPHPSWSPALWESKAVLPNPEDGLLVIPVDAWVWNPEGSYSESGAYVFRVGAEGITHRGIVLHEEGGVQRALYIGDVLYTLSYHTLTASRLADLTPLGTLQLATR